MSCHHRHAHGGESRSDNIRTAFLLNAGFTIFELVGGFLTNSLAVLSDAIHDLGDSVSLGLSFWLERYSEKGASKDYTYGYRRFSLLGALINAIVLCVGSVVILSETASRLFAPEPVNSAGMIGLAVVGVAVNSAAALRLSKGQNENVKVLYWHLLEDVLGWAAVLVGGAIIYFTDLFVIDAILSLGVTTFILINVVRRLNSTVSIFLQATPKELDMDTVISRLLSIGGVVGQHHTHAWSLDGERHVLTTHLLVGEGADNQYIKRQARAVARDLGFFHVTVELDAAGEMCSMSPEPEASDR